MDRQEQIPYKLRQPILDTIDRQFDAEQAQDVRDKLANSELIWGRSACVPRVHFAILSLSQGDIAEFDRQLNQALCDWRDVLIDAGLANEDWREVLATKGVDAQDW